MRSPSFRFPHLLNFLLDIEVFPSWLDAPAAPHLFNSYFWDKMSVQPSGEMRSLAAFIQEMIRTEDVLIFAGKMRDFVSDPRQSDTVGK